MKKFTYLKYLIALIFAIGLFVFQHPIAKAETMNGEVIYPTNLYKSPSSKSTKLTKLPKNKKVLLYFIHPNGWAKVKYGQKIGYIYSVNLNILKKQKTSYTMNPKKVYKYHNTGVAIISYSSEYDYMWSNGKTSSPFLQYVNKNSFVWYQGKKPFQEDPKGYDQIHIIEGSLGLTMYSAHAEGLTLLEYPVINNKKYYFMGPTPVQMNILKKPFTVKAGSFKNVVRVNYGDIKMYLAPNVGIIKITKDGKATRELISLTNQ
ncbi:SH3 domain-containing protein [Rummeliibacillus pycnus]|uniref:SH3 domain-containing protein n=1 Tax=Rummeliibacillus pycnus TaxID=101070 RepID=UPI003D2823B8